ncbi:MAG: LysR family transcriptional regulator [Erythrobacter sp.]|nr:LysR family transcriptional regulator [Erythrobacter sp.]
MEAWDDYRIILALARDGTLRSAASSLGLTHTTVARRLAAMQDRRGVLFDRTPTGYVPTELGLTLVEVAGRMEALAHTGARHSKAAGEDVSGPITLSLPEPIAQYLLLDDLFAFTERYPGIELTVETGFAFADLDRSEADVVVRGTDTPPDHLVGRRLFPNRVTFYANREYLERTPREELRWIAPKVGGLWPDWLETSPYPEVPVGLRIDDITARHRAMIAGLGLGRGACFMADTDPRVVRLTDAAPVAQQDLWVLTHPDLRDTPRIRALMSFLIASLEAKRDLVSGILPADLALRTGG